MTNSITLSLKGNSYYNTGTYSSPVWVLIDQVGDVDIPIEFDEADATNRASGGWEQVLFSLAKSTVDLDVKYNPSNTAWQFLQTTAFARNAVEYAFMDGPIANTGQQGLRGVFGIGKWGVTQKLKEVMATPVTLRPTIPTLAGATFTANPAWFTV